MKVCSECGEEFTPANPKGIFCSSACRQRNYRKKVAALLIIARIKEEKKATGQKNQSENPKNLEELKEMCPKELTGLDRSSWISENRQKYGI